MLENLKKLAFPRRSGSEGEKEARGLILEKLKSIPGAVLVDGEKGKSLNEEDGKEPELEITTEEFSFPSDTARVVFGVMGVLLASLLFLNFVLLFNSRDTDLRYGLFLSSIMIILFLILGPRWNGIIESLGYRTAGFMIQTSNVIARIGNEGNRNLVIMAHYDSKSNAVGFLSRLVLGGTAYILSFVIALYSLVYAWYSLSHSDVSLSLQILLSRTNVVAGFFTLWVVLVITILYFSPSGNDSPGAQDNASGVSVLLELASYFTENPHDKLNIHLVFTTGEEEGMIGAVRFLDNHKDLEKENTFFINLDTVGARGKLLIIGKSCRNSEGINLKQIIKGCACKEKIPYRAMNCAPTVGFDSLPVAYRGYQSINLSHCSMDKPLLSIHSKKDDTDDIDEKALENTLTVCREASSVLNNMQ